MIDKLSPYGVTCQHIKHQLNLRLIMKYYNQKARYFQLESDDLQVQMLTICPMNERLIRSTHKPQLAMTAYIYLSIR